MTGKVPIKMQGSRQYSEAKVATILNTTLSQPSETLRRVADILVQLFSPLVKLIM